MKKNIFPIRIDPELYERLTQAALREERSRGSIVRRALKTYLTRLETAAAVDALETAVHLAESAAAALDGEGVG